MICTCTHCSYTFESDDLPEQCPDCGKYAVRPATEQETDDYLRVRAELDAGLDDWYKNR